ncbi:hypothetical protein QCA50_013586 [Cerrena zonata]|uniref:Uncharacterized protein n=1 Tax=Cerrena zonata TaxID=2478898 RepID=A0AAW0FUX0_9APHY
MAQAHQRDLHQLSTAIQAVQRALFSLNNSASKVQLPDIASKVEEFREAFSNLSWVARDIAGDIRTAAVDFRHVIMGTLQDTQTKNGAKVEMLDSWCKSIETRKRGAQELPQQFERFSMGLADLLRDVRMLQGSDNIAHSNDSKPSSSAQIPRQPIWKRLLSALFGKKPTETRQQAQAPTASGAVIRPSAKTSLVLSNPRKDLSQQSRDLHAGRKLLENEIETTRKKMTNIVTKAHTFGKIYNEVDQHIQTLKKLLSAKTYNAKKESEYNTALASFRPKLEQYAKILEEYQKTVP